MRTYKEKGRIHKKLTRDRKRTVSREKNKGSLMRNTQMVPTSRDPTNCTMDFNIPTFDFQPYTEMIRNLYMRRCQRKYEGYQEMSNHLTLPLPESLWSAHSDINRINNKIKNDMVIDYGPKSRPPYQEPMLIYR